MRRLAARGGVAFAMSVLAVLSAGPAAATGGGPEAPQFYFDTWHLPQLWASGASGQGVTIAEIDTGVDASLGIFRGRLLAGIDFGRLGGNGQVDRDKDPYGHGTSMASIMVGRPGALGIAGVAPGAKLLPVAIPLAGTTDAASDDHLAQAIRWSADHGAKIISMSLGGVRRSVSNSTACPDDEQQAIFHALSVGALVFAASGNRGDQDNAIEEPGVCLGVVAVGATNRLGEVASFSSRHRYLTLTAPGVDIASIGPGGTPYAGNGTSQATAIASAVAALVWSRYPGLSAAQLLARLLATTDGHRDTPDPAYGYGTVNAYRAVTAAVPADAPDPVYALAMPFVLAGAAQARASGAPAPAPIARAAAPPGTFSVRADPRLLTPRVVDGAVVAAAGLALLLALAVIGLLGRRRRRLAAVLAAARAYEPLPPGPGGPPAGPAPAGPPPAGPAPDDPTAGPAWDWRSG